jgi:hypothetical protein
MSTYKKDIELHKNGTSVLAKKTYGTKQKWHVSACKKKNGITQKWHMNACEKHIWDYTKMAHE